MTITQIEKSIKNLLSNLNKESFIFDFLLAYGEPKSTIARLRKSELNQLKHKAQLLHRKKLFFKIVTKHLHSNIEDLKEEFKTQKQKPRFLVVTDYKNLLAYDTKTQDSLDIEFEALTQHYDFFLPLAGMEKAQYQEENIADVKASAKLAKLYDEILKSNKAKTKEDIHALNIFLTRLLFCYFAEDTNIFKDNQFTNAIGSHTQSDGSDLDVYLARLFEVFNIEKRDKNLPKYLKDFPYVNGGLFETSYPIPKFTTKSRGILIDIGSLGWGEINPDIFGSMIQAVITPEHRGGMGMHYTSVPNIMKVMQPLFLDELYEEFEKVKSNKRKLQSLIVRISNLKIFDPACGSGNFLIIAYKELRLLEMKIFKQIDILAKQKSFVFSEIRLAQFYGIELDDFAHEVAKLSLWLAEHQMNLEFFKEFGRTSPSLPLQNGGNIVHGNATRLDWEVVCPKEEGDEIYILGNPPYLGSRNQDKSQKNDIDYVFKKFKKRRKLDYISAWFYLAGKYINKINAKFAFVSTNSICQGEQVAILWKIVLESNKEINFAYQSFIWKNNAKGNAGVTVSIIGISNKSNKSKKLYMDNHVYKVNEINTYLYPAPTIYIESATKPISELPIMVRGNYTGCCSSLILTENEKETLLNENINSNKFIKSFIGSSELIKSQNRYCLWIKDDELKEALLIDNIKNRIEKVKKERESSSDKGQQKLVYKAHQFREFNETETHSIIIPVVSSIKRDYIPCGFVNKNIIVPNSAQIIYNCEYWIFSIVSSRIHMKWVDILAGRLRSDYRYSSSLCYNTFPFPPITQKQKDELTEHAFNVLDEREKHSEKTLAQLYDPNKMPQGLKEAHHQLDLAVERCYRTKPFVSDEERLGYLFGLYEEMVGREKR